MPDLFRAELRNIDRIDSLDIIEIDAPATHGWLRRPEYDELGLKAWERPNGTLAGVKTEGAAEATNGKGATAARSRP